MHARRIQLAFLKCCVPELGAANDANHDACVEFVSRPCSLAEA